MPVYDEVIKKIADDTGFSVSEITISGMLALLREKKRKVMIDRLELLDRYSASSGEEIERKIKSGEIPEHPAWEDLILLENFESVIDEIDEDIRAIQETS